MLVPNVHLAIIEQQKIVDYLLNPVHPDNGGKANFFVRLGFAVEHWEALRDALREVVMAYPISEFDESPHGRKYLVIGELRGSNKKSEVRSVWIIDRGSENLRLVTADPQR